MMLNKPERKISLKITVVLGNLLFYYFSILEAVKHTLKLVCPEI